MSEVARGRVIRAQSRRFTVKLEDRVVHARIPNRMRFEHPEVVDPVAVGDMVSLAVSGDEGLIQSVEPRRNVLSRAALGRSQRQLLAANVDLLVIVLSVQEPAWKPATLDRYLVLASAAGIPALVCLNKVDLEPGAALDPRLGDYRPLESTVIVVSAADGTGLAELEEALAGKTVVLVGPSGAGKSSLMNRLVPDALARVGEVSTSTGKGTHTTTWVEMHDLPGGGRLIDSPGLRTLDLTGVSALDLGAHFPEFESRLGSCRFSDCLHRTEPGCGILDAVASGEIPSARHASYLKILQSLERGDG